MSLDFIRDRDSHLTISNKTFFKNIYSITTTTEEFIQKGDVVLVEHSNGIYKLYITVANNTEEGLSLVEYIPHRFVRESKISDYSYLERILYLIDTEIKCIYKSDTETYIAESIDSNFRDYEFLHDMYGLTINPSSLLTTYDSEIEDGELKSYESLLNTKEGGYYIRIKKEWFKDITDLHTNGYTLTSSTIETLYKISTGEAIQVAFNDTNTDNIHGYRIPYEDSKIWVNKNRISEYGYTTEHP